MNKKFRQFITLILATLIFFSMSVTVFAGIGKWTKGETTGIGEITINGQTFTGYTATYLSREMGLDEDEIADEYAKAPITNGGTYYVEKNEVSSMRSAQSTELENTSNQSMRGIVDNAKGDISQISDSMSVLKPDIGRGFGIFGDSVKDLVQLGLSALIVVGWIWFLFTLAFNGILVAAPGAYEVVVGNSGGGTGGYGAGMGGGNQKKGLGIFVSRNTQKVMGGGGQGGYPGAGGEQQDEQPLKTWMKLEIKTIVFFVIVTVCLFNGLFFKLIDFITGFINF